MYRESTIYIKGNYRSSVNLFDIRRVWGGLAQTFSGVESCRELLNVLRLPCLVHVAQCHVAEEQKT